MSESGSVWEGRGYASQATHHRSLDDWFLERCPPAHDHVVVDAGCGTGEFSAAVAARLDELRRHDGSFDQTFVRLHVLARRPD